MWVVVSSFSELLQKTFTEEEVKNIDSTEDFTLL